jgi:uncharacterized protein
MAHDHRFAAIILFCFCGVLLGFHHPILAAEDGFQPPTITDGTLSPGQQAVPYDEASKGCSPSVDSGLVADLKTAAEAGDIHAQWKLGMMYYHGDGAPQNYGEARKWFRKAAEHGEPWAQLALGLIYYKGHGVQKDYAEALKWYQKTAEQGQVPGQVAQYKIGNMHYFGEGVLQDYALAAKWFRRAAEQGNAQAQFSLGFMCDKGLGVPRNLGEAMKWYREAASQGDLDAQTGLAGKYYSGEGIPKNYGEAAKWYRKAAEQRDSWAQRNLAALYKQGQGPAKDYVTAYFWADMAAAQGNEEASALRQELSLLMTPDQLLQARKVTSNWKYESSNPPVEARTVSDPGQERPSPSAQESPLIAGTGLVVSRDGHILTSCHALKGCLKVACDLGGKLVPLTVVQTDSRNDLVLLKLSAPGPAPLKFREGKPVGTGDGALVVGYPLQETPAHQPQAAKGTVSAILGPGKDPGILQIKVVLHPKNNGGPLLDAAGNVVGVVTAKLDPLRTTALGGDLPQNLNFAINAAVVRAFLEANGVAYESARSTSKPEASAIGDNVKRATVLIVCSKEQPLGTLP